MARASLAESALYRLPPGVGTLSCLRRPNCRICPRASRMAAVIRPATLAEVTAATAGADPASHRSVDHAFGRVGAPRPRREREVEERDG